MPFKELQHARGLMDEGRSSIIYVTTNNGTIQDLQPYLDTAEKNYISALGILNDPSMNGLTDMKSTLLIYKKMCDYNLQIVDSAKNKLEYTDHISKANSFLATKNFSAAQNELDMAEQSLALKVNSLKNAKQIMNSIDLNITPIEETRQIGYPDF